MENKEKNIVEKNKEKPEVAKVEDKVVQEKEVNPEIKAEKNKLENKIKKEEAVAKSLSIHASKRHSMYICNFIKGKSIDEAISDLEKVIKMKKVVPFKGEIPHRKGKGMMSGRYPVNASKIFISILKSLKGNASVNGLNLEKTKIIFCSANWASRSQKSSGGRFKRTNVILKAKEFK